MAPVIEWLTGVFIMRKAVSTLVLSAAALVVVQSSSLAKPLVTGTFTGTAFNSLIFAPPPGGGNFDGTKVTGSFRIDLTGCTDQSFGNPFIGPNCGGSSFPFDNPNTFIKINSVKGLAYFHLPEYISQLTNTATSQILTTNFAFMDPYSSAFLTIAGGPNAFIKSLDFSTLHAGTIDLAGSSLSFQAGRSYRSQVALTSLRFDSVPESGSLLALATMLGAGVATLRARRAALL